MTEIITAADTEVALAITLVTDAAAILVAESLTEGRGKDATLIELYTGRLIAAIEAGA